MLSQFTFRNYRSYKNETVFDFEAANAEELATSLIISKSDNKRFLPVSVVYGPNGGGKSNLLRAFICMVSTVVHPIYVMEKAVTSVDSMYCKTCHPFLFDEASRTDPTDFEVYFRTNEVDYRYTISLLDGSVIEESLYRRAVGVKKPTRLFTRDNASIHLGATMKKSKVTTAVNEKMPFLSLIAATYSIPEIDEAAEWFESCILQSYASPIADLIMRIVNNPKEKRLLLSVIRGVDSCIVNYEPVYDEERKPKGLNIIRNVNGHKVSLPLDEESDGTKKMFQLLPLFINSLANGKLLVVDEMDAKLHPTLLRYLIGLYNDPTINTKGAQLWFTSHDLTTMTNEVFRRDEIWFSYRDLEESSRIYSLYDIRTPRNEKVDVDAAYNKQYLEGRYGADPYFERIREWGERK